ncbi:argonaute 1 [Borealophlyctis nickersoniae]|nr:argonaute 1 [Borealophlyctis nickersoniae]
MQGDNPERPQLILIVLPDTGQRLYGEIKRVGDTVVGVATQCVQSKHVLERKVRYCANVCLKINAKLGGYNAYLGKSQLPFIYERPIMIVGADVSAFDAIRPSIAALVGIVGSLNLDCTKITAAMRLRKQRVFLASGFCSGPFLIHLRSPATKTKTERPPNGEPRRQDVIQDVQGMMIEHLNAFYEVYNMSVFFFYHDGVSDGQFANVQFREVSDIALACREIHPEYAPKITFVVVQKRHSARFFPMDEKGCDRSKNVKAGTVVDKTVVDPNDFDFYLNSHAGIQGTSRPAHYYVLEDQNNFTSDALQQLTYRLCYLYARATRSVSVVPPV